MRSHALSRGVSPVRNTAASGCMVFCISRRISAVPRAPLALRSRSRRATAPLAGAGGERPRARRPGVTSSAQRRAASRPNTTRSSSELRAEAVGAVHRDAGRLADGHQARHHGVRVAFLQRHDLAVVVAGDAAHVVVHGRQHRDRLAGHVDAGEDARGLGDARQALVDDVRPRGARGAGGCGPCSGRRRGPRGSRSSSRGSPRRARRGPWHSGA